MTKEEKVCLTGGQLENISKAYAKEKYHVQVTDSCPKADKFVRGYFVEKKPEKKKKKEKDPEEIVSDWIVTKVLRKLSAKLDEIF